jgi:quercetin dioxygenase-like cupin family protein
MVLQIRRVVTGVTSEGKSISYEDTVLKPVELAIMPGVQMFQTWGTEGPVTSPVADPVPSNRTFFPGPGGTRFGLFRLPPEQASPEQASPEQASPEQAGPPEQASEAVPESAAPVEFAETTLAAQVAEAEEKVPGLLGIFEPDHPGMHQTQSVDYVIVLEGDLWLELDDGAEVHLPAGTCVIQNGARHGWRNHGAVPATLAYVIIDAAAAK